MTIFAQSATLYVSQIGKALKGEKMKVLFLSRHSMTEEQTKDLSRIFPGCTVDKLDTTIENAEQLLCLCEGYDVLAAVLPLHMYAELYKIKPEHLRVVFSKTERVALNQTGINNDSGLEESRYRFVHNGWYEVETLKCQINKL